MLFELYSSLEEKLKLALESRENCLKMGGNWPNMYDSAEK
jgi:hypothetical protein